MHPDTQLVSFDPAPGDPTRPRATPIHQTATFGQPSATACGPYDYSRTANPTRDVLQRQVAALEGGGTCAAFASGLAAIAAVTRGLLPGDEVVVGDDLYGGTWRLLERLVAPRGVMVRAVDAADLDAVASRLGPATRLLFVETPTNPRQRIADIAGLAELSARWPRCRLVVDNTLLSPLGQRPLDLGADAVLHSATKHLGGHGDVIAGVVTTRDAGVAEELAFVQNAEGAGLAPFDAWLVLRGMKTLAVRLRQQQATARRLACFLAAHPAVSRVWYAGLPDHPGHALHRRQATGDGSVLSFATGDPAASAHVVEATRLFAISVSFGSVGSLISLPCHMSHASIPAARRAHAPPQDLVRVSVGLEDPADLQADLEQALAGLSRRRVRRPRGAPTARSDCPAGP